MATRSSSRKPAKRGVSPKRQGGRRTAKPVTAARKVGKGRRRSAQPKSVAEQAPLE